MDSGEFQERQEGAVRIQADVKLLEGSKKVDKVIGNAQTIKARFAIMDQEEAEVAKQEAEEYLGLALRSYLAVLCQGSGSRSQAAVYRLVALWFANAESNPVLNSVPTILPEVSFRNTNSYWVNDFVFRSLAGSLCLCCTSLQREWRFPVKATVMTQQQLSTTWSCVVPKSTLTMPSLSSLHSSTPKKMKSGSMGRILQALHWMQGVSQPLRLQQQ